MSQTFNTKWTSIYKARKGADEKSLFVDVGGSPKTQRQLNLYYYFKFIQNILKNIDVKDIIEVGCGRGTIALYLSKYLNLVPHLLDDQEDAIKLAKESFQEHDRQASFFVKDVLQTGFLDQSYDAIVSIGLAEHFEDPKGLFQEQYRLLRPGGVMISLNIPKKKSIQELNVLFRFFKKLLGMYVGDVRQDYYRSTLTPEEFIATAEKVGFKNITATYVCPFPIFVPVTLSTDKRLTKIYKSILSVRKLFQKYPYKTNRLIAQAHFLVAYK